MKIENKKSNKKFFVQVFGCLMNYSDAERVSRIMEEIGYSKTTEMKNADAIFFITCSVRHTAEDRVFGLKHEFEKLKESNPELKVVLTGCMANREFRTEPDKMKSEEKRLKYQNTLSEKLPWVDLILPIENISKLYKYFGKEDIEAESYFSIEPNYTSKSIAYVPISTGCNNFCSYCIVPYTRGQEKSRPFEEIFQEVQSLVEKGYKEINLLGQNVNSYGNDLNEKNLFPKLLSEIDNLDSDFWIRFTSCHPKDVSEELMNVIADSKHIVHQVHFALQSGNNEILARMNRPYTREKYLELVKKFKEKIPDIALTTDVIVGFPGETEEQFLDTKSIMEEVGFSKVYINKYSPRKGTESAKLKNDVSWKEKGRRKNILNDVLTSTSNNYNKRFLNKEIKILVTDSKNGNLFGHNAEGIDVKCCPPDKRETKRVVSQFAKVKITETGSWGMKGIIIYD